MFVDASAIVGILAAEDDALKISSKLCHTKLILISPIVKLEAAMGLARALNVEPAQAQSLVNNFLSELSAREVVITSEIGDEAIAAHIRFGKGRHKARLNFGDCFAYACARIHKVPLLVKGDDFIHTDIQVA